LVDRFPRAEPLLHWAVDLLGSNSMPMPIIILGKI